MSEVLDALASMPSTREAEWTPTATFDGVSGEVATKGYASPVDTADTSAMDQLLRDAGLEPDEVMVVGHPRVSIWDVPGHGKQWAYRFRLAPRPASRAAAKTVLAGIRKGKAPKAAEVAGGHWLTMQIGDVHLGKSAEAGGGTESIVARYNEALDRALSEYRVLKALGIAGVHVAFVGDLIEGVVSQGGKNISLMDLSLTEQILAAQRLVVQTVRTFADLGLPMIVSSVGGNHGDTQRVAGGPLGDNHDVGIVAAAADMVRLLPQYEGRVEFVFPPRVQSHVTYPVGDTVFVSVHGHQFSGATAFQKARKWWEGHSLSGMPAGAAHVLMAGHFHTFSHSTISRSKTAIYSPSFENMSSWYNARTGATSKRGAALYLTRAGEVSNLSII